MVFVLHKKVGKRSKQVVVLYRIIALKLLQSRSIMMNMETWAFSMENRCNQTHPKIKCRVVEDGQELLKIWTQSGKNWIFSHPQLLSKRFTIGWRYSSDLAPLRFTIDIL